MVELKAKAYERQIYEKYGVTLDLFQSLWSVAKGKCQICDVKLKSALVPGYDGKFKSQPTAHIDHCHETGKVRGLLCIRCNTSIGRLEDNADLLRAAIRFLERGTTDISNPTGETLGQKNRRERLAADVLAGIDRDANGRIRQHIRKPRTTLAERAAAIRARRKAA
jgi:hypothetical protein